MRNVHQEIKSTVIWMVFATFLGLAGIWQTKVVIARDLQTAHKNLPPPLKTRVVVRPPTKIFLGDVVEDYVDRCTKGLTNQQIRWILADFRNAGLDSPPAEGAADKLLMAYHQRQNQWYGDAIADALRLSPSQLAEVNKNLADLLRGVADASEYGSAGELMEGFTKDQIHALFQNGFFAKKSAEWLRLPPRGLFTPNSQQRDILSHSWGAETHDTIETDSPTNPASPLEPTQSTLKGKTAATYPIEEDDQVPVGFHEVDQTFPILKSQQLVGVGKDDPNASDSLIDNIRRLHPAQLKSLLLFQPEMAEKIQAVLDQAD